MQMMLMLTESFSKLSTVLADKNQETKSDWPSFWAIQRSSSLGIFLL
jgi:hypothetical protein